MNIACSIYVLIAVSFLCTASADESSAPRENGNLAKRVKINARNIDAMERKILKSKAILESKVADLEGEDDTIDKKVMALRKKAKELNDVVVEFSGTVMDVNESIADLAVRIQNTTEDVNGAVLELDGKLNDSNQNIADLGRQFKKTIKELTDDILKLDENFTNADVEVDRKVVELNEEIADLGGQLNATTDDLTDLDEAVTGVEEKIKLLDEADVKVEGKVAKLNEEIEVLGGKFNTTTDDLTDLDGVVTGLEEKIKLLEEALDVALKVEEIQFYGVASQSSNDYRPDNYASINCIDGSKSKTVVCQTSGDAASQPWWQLQFTKDVVINRIVIYSEYRMHYTAGNRVSILSAAGTIVWANSLEKEEKPVYVLAVPNIVGQYVKIEKGNRVSYNNIIMREVAVFGRYD